VLSKEQKKEAAAKFKEKKACIGVYAVRCAPTGQVWVGTSRNLEAAGNGIWFALRIGTHREGGLQEVWNAQGQPAFEYEVLEKIKDDISPLLIVDLLKARKLYWLTQLNARALL
jgi:hypothetical protein